MIKLSILYPNKPGSRFDINYYVATHMPLAMRLLKKNLRKTEVDAGLQGTAPGEAAGLSTADANFISTASPRSRSLGPAAAELQADIPRYTDVARSFNSTKSNCPSRDAASSDDAARFISDLVYASALQRRQTQREFNRNC